MSNAEILVIKIGQVQSLTFADGSCYESAIRKQPVEAVNIHSLGAEGNDVGLKAHHGGVDKALFFMSADSFPALNALLDENFSYQGTAIYGENFVVSELYEVPQATIWMCSTFSKIAFAPLPMDSMTKLSCVKRPCMVFTSAVGCS